MSRPGLTGDRVPAAEVLASREELLSDAIRMWPGESGESTEQTATALRRASAGQLARVLGATSYDEVNSILAGPRPNAFGSAASDYVYTPVAPCRILDTRNTAAGPITAGGTRDFWMYGTTIISNQGGNASGCVSPRGEPRAVHINLTAIPLTPAPAGPGNLPTPPTSWPT